MNINDLIAIVKKKLDKEIILEKIEIEDKSFLHKSHSGHQKGKFHLKLNISSIELKKLNKIGVFMLHNCNTKGLFFSFLLV